MSGHSRKCGRTTADSPITQRSRYHLTLPLGRWIRDRRIGEVRVVANVECYTAIYARPWFDVFKCREYMPATSMRRSQRARALHVPRDRGARIDRAAGAGPHLAQPLESEVLRAHRARQLGLWYCWSNSNGSFPQSRARRSRFPSRSSSKNTPWKIVGPPGSRRTVGYVSGVDRVGEDHEGFSISA